MIHTAISSTVDGSVVVAIDMNVSDAEKELARLKKEIFKLENDVGRNAAQKASLQEKYTEKLSQYNKFLKEHTQRDEDGKFITPEDGKTADLLYKEVLKIWENINKYDEALRNSNVSLHWTKNRYGEIAREAEKLRAEAEQTASAANASDAGFEKMSQEAEEVNRKLHELADQYANLAEEGVDFDPNSEEFLKLRQEIEDCVLYLDKLAESGQLSELSSGAEIAEDRIADLTNTIEEYQYRLDNYDLPTDQREILGEKVKKGKQLLESYQSILDKISNKAKETEVANQHIVDLNKELLSLKQRQKELEGRGFGIGHVEYDKNASRIKKINQELKEYEKTLIEVNSAEEATKPTESIVSEMDQAMEKESKSLEKLAQSQSRINAFLEKSSSLHQKFSNMISKTTEMSSLLQDVAAATTGKMSGMFQSAGTALSGFSTKLSGIASKAGPYIAIAVAIIGIVKKLTKSFSDFGKTAANSFTTAVNSAKKLAPLLAELGSLAASAAKKVLLFVKNLNVFSKLSENLSRKFKRLGSTIKSALVFSVMYKGLSILREQMGKHLSVNTQFMTALRRLQGVLLTAFQPIYEVVVPALTTLINVLARAAATVTQFFASLFGTTAKQAQTNAKDLYEQANATTAAGEAAEEASKQLAGFDEINKLEGNKSAGGGGSTSVDTGPLFDYEYDETPFESWGEAFSAFLDKLLAGIPKLRDAFKNFADWLNDLTKKLYDMFTFPGVLEKVKQLGRDLANALNDLVNWIEWYQLGQALGAGLNLALNFLTSFIYEFDWMNLGKRLAEMINGLVSEIDWYEFGRLLWAGFKIGLETLAGFLLGLDMPQLAKAASNIVVGFFNEMLNTIQKIPWGKIGTQIAEFLVNLDWYGMLSSIASAIAAGLMAAVAAVKGFLNRIVPELDRIANEIVTALIEFFRDKVDWGEMARTIGDGITAALRFVAGLLDPELFYEIGKAIGDFFINLQWVEIFGALTEALANGINAAIAALKGFLESVTPEKLKEIADGIAKKINEFVEKVEWSDLGRTISQGIEAALNFMIELMDQIDWDAIGAAICEFLENIDWDTLLAKWGTLMGQFIDAKLRAVDLSGALNIGMDIVAGLAKGMWNKFQESGGVLGWLKSLLVDPILNGIKNLLGIHSPSTVFAEIGGFLIAGLLQGISDTWHTIIEFFSEKIENLKRTLSDAWDNIKNSASEKWASIKEMLGNKWDEIRESAKTKFDEICKKISDAWDSIKTDVPKKWDEIKTALSTAWDRVKTSAGEAFSKIKDTIIEKMDALKTFDWFETGKTIVDGILNGLESIWNSLTSWAKSVKDTISDALSGSSSSRGGGFGTSRSGGFGGNSRIAVQSVPDMANFTIPKLAQGAVIPPNREFLAVLGDQKHGNNLEGPESSFEAAVARGIRAAGGLGGNRPITVILQVDRRELGRVVYEVNNEETQRVGVRLTEART